MSIQADLKLETEVLQQHINNIISPIAYLDAEFNFILVNKAYASADDKEPEYFLGKNHFDLYPNKENKEIFKKVVETGKEYKAVVKPFEYEKSPERGETYWDWELAPIRDGNDRTQALMLSLIDVTERVIAQENLSQNLLEQEIISSILKLCLQPLSFKEILRQALVLTLQITNLPLCYQGVIFLKDKKSDELVMAVRHGLPDSIVSSCERIKRGECICGIAFEQEKTIFTSCLDNNHHISYKGIIEHGHYCVPIKSQDEILGVLNLYVEQGHQSSENEMQFVSAIADTLAGIILREQTSNALKESELRFRMINMTARDAIISVDKDGNIISWNEGSESIFGYSPNEMMGQPVTKIMPARFRERHIRGLKKWAKDENLQHSDSLLEFYGLTKKGQEIPLEIVLSSWKMNNENHITGIVRDISQRKESEIKLKHSAAVFDNAMEGIVITDNKTNILSVNHAVTDITGYNHDELLGKSPNVWKSGRHDSRFFQSMWQEITSKGEWKGEIWNRHKNGDAFPCWQTIRAIKDENDHIINYISIITDISNIKASQEKIEYLAHHDPLTGLPNRMLFHARLEHAITKAHRDKTNLALLFIDLDRFKHINDSFGHAFGDILLKEVANRLSDVLREEDTVARIGGDEFPILLENIMRVSEVTIVGEKLLKAFEEPINIQHHSLYIGLSIGVSLYPADAEDCATLIRNADTAMYKAKAKGRNTYQFYSASFTQEAEKRIHMENRLRQAIKGNEFNLFYQPKYDLVANELHSVEALIRWQPSDSKLISPDDFIPLSEETGLILDIGKWVIETACKQIKQWKECCFPIQHIAINISGKQLQQCSFAKDFKSIVQGTGCRPEWIEIEVTESCIMEQTKQACAHLTELRDFGIGIAIDDFGTGYSSLSYLKQLPLTTLKIDKSFIMNIPKDKDDVAISKAIIALGNSLSLKLIAEGIETEEQQQFLIEEGCNEGQGYLYSPPIPNDVLIKEYFNEKLNISLLQKI